MTPIWEHKKTGGLYVIITDGKLEADQTLMIVYKALKTGQVWIRPSVEFYERFIRYN